jgi:hypothetical protein
MKQKYERTEVNKSFFLRGGGVISGGTINDNILFFVTAINELAKQIWPTDKEPMINIASEDDVKGLEESE